MPRPGSVDRVVGGEAGAAVPADVAAAADQDGAGPGQVVAGVAGPGVGKVGGRRRTTTWTTTIVSRRDVQQLGGGGRATTAGTAGDEDDILRRGGGQSYGEEETQE